MQHYQRYVPPELEGTTSANRLNQRRAPGTLKNDGSQTVRFEMPFAVWCHTCRPQQIIGQGVRFNAEKRKVGNYYSTPIWSFRMKHVACDGTIEIKTDPQNTAYVVVAGGKARDFGNGKDQVREGENGEPRLTTGEREKRRQDAFAQLEGKVQEKAQTKDNAKRIRELYATRERDWEDPWTSNRKMRQSFRVERKALQKEEENTQAIKDRIGTDMELLPAAEEDAIRAKLVVFGEDATAKSQDQASSRPMFRNPPHRVSKTKSRRSSKPDAKEILRRQLLSNTRAVLNPF